MTSPQTPHLSLIIPALESSDPIAESLDNIENFFAKFPVEYEVHIVHKKGLADKKSQAHVTWHELQTGQGRGAAVKKGALASQGQLIFVLDSHLSTPLAEIIRYMTELEDSQAGVLIGNRRDSKSRLFRQWPSWQQSLDETLNTLVRQWLKINVSDCFCGFKVLRAEIAQSVFSEINSEGEAYEAEFLWLLEQNGILWMEKPISWVHHPAPRMKAGLRFMKTLSDLVKLRGRLPQSPRPTSDSPS